VNSPNFFRPPAAEFKDQLTRSQKIQEFNPSASLRVVLSSVEGQNLKGRLLREEGRSGTIVPAGVAEPVGVELDLAVVEVEERREREAAIGVRRELVTSAVDVELFPLNVAFGVGQQHDADSEGTETELVGHEDLASPTNRTALVTETELTRNDEDVVILLLVAELLEHLHRLGMLSQVLRSELAVTVVVELSLRRDHRDHLLDGLTIGRCERLPLRDGEPPFGVRGKRLFGQLLIGKTDAREELTQDVGLLRDPLDLVALGIRVARLDFLVGELVGHREILDAGDDMSLELVAVLNELLDAVLVEETLGNCAIHGIFREPLDLLLLSVCDGGDQCFHCHPPSFFGFARVALANGFLCMR